MQTKFYTKYNIIKEIFLYLSLILLFFPIFFSFYNGGIRFDIVGKFDKNFNDIKYYVLPANFLFSFFLIFFFKIKISLKKLILNLFLVLWIYNLYNNILHDNFLKAFLLSFIILNYPIIFDCLLNKFKDKKKIIHIFKLIFIALSLILLLNWALFDMTFLLSEKFRIYSDLVQMKFNYTPNTRDIVDNYNLYSITYQNVDWRIADSSISNDRMSITLICYFNKPSVDV